MVSPQYGNQCKPENLWPTYFCLSIDGPTFYDLISKILPIRPFFYAQNFYNPSMITDLIAQGIIEEPDYKSDFTYKNVTKKVLGFSLWN